MSPYLFMLCMDKLSHMIYEAVDRGKWVSIKSRRRDPIISHLMFADDLLLFEKATRKQMDCMNNVLTTFC